MLIPLHLLMCLLMCRYDLSALLNRTTCQTLGGGFLFVQALRLLSEDDRRGRKANRTHLFSRSLVPPVECLHASFLHSFYLFIYDLTFLLMRAGERVFVHNKDHVSPLQISVRTHTQTHTHTHTPLFLDSSSEFLTV